MSKHIAVLRGGLSSEREVSLSSGAAVVKACEELGYDVTDIDVADNISQTLTKAKPDIAFNALHGTYGEDGSIQGVLEFLKIPYTHSGVLASSLAMHKEMAKALYESVGIQCTSGEVISRKDVIAENLPEKPFVVKPVNEGSSVDVFVIKEDTNFSFTEETTPYYKEFLVEKYVDGKELTVAVLGGKALAVIEIVPKNGFYNYDNKYVEDMTEYIIPAEIDKDVYDKALEWAESADNVLGCRGVSRADFRLCTESGELFMMEINTHPGLTPTSLVPKAAAYKDISFNDLVEELIKCAELDNKQHNIESSSTQQYG